MVNDLSISEKVNSMILDAVKLKASDIHIEPQEENVRIRFRIDGILKDFLTVSKNFQTNIASILKIKGNLDISEKRVPQDGNFRINIKNSVIDIRIATLPTIYGEKIALRILDKSSQKFSVEKLGLSPETCKRFLKLITYPHGMILVTGPAGSGKTTTLYAALSKLNTVEKNIITIEDPVEYTFQGITQTNVNYKAGYTFAKGLKGILRQDPDVIMVGEIRDVDTAKIAIQAANTGHLVLSTLHTNDAASTLSRLYEMGIEPYLLSASVNGILSQRLVRVICDECKESIEFPLGSKEKRLLKIKDKKYLKLYVGKGCKKCSYTGFYGRTAVSELLVLNSDLREMVLKKVSKDEIRAYQKKEKIPTLWDDAISKVLNGITTVEEIEKVIFEEV